MKQLTFFSISSTTQSLFFIFFILKKGAQIQATIFFCPISLFSTFSGELCTLEKTSRQSFLWTYLARCEQPGENGGHMDQWDPMTWHHTQVGGKEDQN